MAQDFQGSGDCLKNTALPSQFNMVAGSSIHAFTLWLNADSYGSGAGSQSNHVFIHDDAVDVAQDDGWGFAFGDITGTNNCRIFTAGGNTGDVVSAAPTASWFHALAIFDQANTTVQIYIDNVQKYSNTSYADTSVMTSPEIKFGANWTDVYGWDGKMADVALLSVVPSAGQRAALAKGFSPLLVMPQSIIEYWPWIRSTSGVKGTALSKTGTVDPFAHPPIIMPAPPLIVGVPAAAGFVQKSVAGSMDFVAGALTKKLMAKRTAQGAI